MNGEMMYGDMLKCELSPSELALLSLALSEKIEAMKQRAGKNAEQYRQFSQLVSMRNKVESLTMP